MNYRLQEVTDKKTARTFLDFQATLYKNDPSYIRPLDKDIESVFDPEKNKFFGYGKAIRWILRDEQSKVVGRIAAFYNTLTAHDGSEVVGGMGFFDCINNREAAFTLFDACKRWLRENGIEAMDGPINFGERDKWWGLLVDGFTPPSYNMNYNAPYYRELLEAYGFKSYFEQYSYLRPVDWTNVSDALKQKAERLAQNPDYSFRFLSKKTLDKAAADFCYIYNKAWVQHTGVPAMTKEHANELMRTMKPILDERLIVFAYHKDEPIGFFIQIPEINQVIKHLNGKFGLYHKLKFMYLLKVKKVCNRVLGLTFGVSSDYRAKGVEGAMVIKFSEAAFSKDFPYKDLDLMWVGDFNPVMMRFQGQIGGKIYKTHVTYRLYFDEDRQQNRFERAPKMGKPKEQS